MGHGNRPRGQSAHPWLRRAAWASSGAAVLVLWANDDAQNAFRWAFAWGLAILVIGGVVGLLAMSAYQESSTRIGFVAMLLALIVAALAFGLALNGGSFPWEA